MKTEIDITDEQQRRLDAICRAKGRPASELLREALDAVLAATEQDASEMTMEERMAIRLAGAGLWKHHKLDTDEYLEELRSEWDR